jgi:hypothetical protein
VVIMSGSPVDDGPGEGQTQSTPDLLADALSPVVDPAYGSGSPAGTGSDGGDADSGPDKDVEKL